MRLLLFNIALWGLTAWGLTSCSEPAARTQALTPNLLIMGNNIDTAIFANGCFWCTEVIFQQLKGVHKVTSGYTGGQLRNPSYEEVSRANTGHAEAIQLIYDPEVISYDELLEVFWMTHDPTTLNRQGNDVGPQYRSAIFYRTEGEKQKAENYKNRLNEEGVFDAPIVTAIEPFEEFFAAENYHQNYYNRNPDNGYCTFVIRPKLEKFKKVFHTKLRNN